MIGYKRIPDEWKSGIPAIADTKFQYTDFTFRTIVESTQKRAIAMVRKHGGRLQGDTLAVRTENPKPAKLELWDDYGSPVERVGTSDSRWQWKGSWRQDKTSRISSAKGAEVAFAFDGTGAIVVGPYLPTGGKADVLLDGKLDRTVDVYPDEDARKGGESVWHSFGLQNGKHTVRLVVRGETYPGSKGADVAIEEFVIFR